MAFSSRRGRPRKEPVVTDFGTPELRFKHAHGITAEPIDLCLQRELITDDQHWCSLHLRWLHTLRYGAPQLTTRYPQHAIVKSTQDDPAWREMREQEYGEAVTMLRAYRCYQTVMHIAVQNHMPSFLVLSGRSEASLHADLIHRCTRELHTLQTGLAMLVDLWKKPSTHPSGDA